ncbi:matrix-remodeling-associated protein 7 isoform X1 [Xenopus laevis]|uniref:Matrix-remodeling-associated protein 7 isoform X1 n=1 Tax=Xenopus laevis TaxID=8355 RepID=A0A8J1LRP2_XENLA|nr:matrix-remodeling-associated protein 7 isoform X1 [Xenopus laevis]
MEYAAEYSFALPLIFTALAVVLATLLLKLRSGGGKPQAEVAEEDKEKVTETLEKEERIQEEIAEATEVTDDTDSGKIPVEEIGAREEPPLEEAKEPEAVQSPANKTRTPSQSSQEEDDSKEDDLETESDKVLKISEADDADDEDSSFKYLPGKMRGSEFQKIFTKDELDEEQRSEDDMKLPLDTS